MFETIVWLWLIVHSVTVSSKIELAASPLAGNYMQIKSSWTITSYWMPARESLSRSTYENKSGRFWIFPVTVMETCTTRGQTHQGHSFCYPFISMKASWQLKGIFPSSELKSRSFGSNIWQLYSAFVATLIPSYHLFSSHITSTFSLYYFCTQASIHKPYYKFQLGRNCNIQTLVFFIALHKVSEQ